MVKRQKGKLLLGYSLWLFFQMIYETVMNSKTGFSRELMSDDSHTCLRSDYNEDENYKIRIIKEKEKSTKWIENVNKILWSMVCK